MSESRAFQFKNGSRSTLLSAISAASTQLTVQEGEGDKFPVLASGQIFSLILWDANLSYYEVCYCTARSGDVLTIERAKEGSTAHSFVAGSIAVHNVTIGFLQQIAGVRPTTPVLSSNLVNNDEADLSWTASVPVLGTITQYNIFRSVNGGSFVLLSTVSGATLDYSDTGLSIGTTYAYYVVAVASTGPSSAVSNTVTEITGTPEYLVASDSSGGAVFSQDAVTWVQNTTPYTSPSTVGGICFGAGVGAGDGRWLITQWANKAAYSDDGGVSWTQTTIGTAENDERCLRVFGYFFAGTNNRSFWKSTTGLGGSWVLVDGTIWVADVHYASPLGMLVTCGYSDSTTPAIRYTTNGVTMQSASLTGLTTGHAADMVNSIAYDATRGYWYCYQGRTGEIFRTVDLAAGTWTLVATVDVALAYAPSRTRFAISDGGVIVLATGVTGLWTSTDGLTFTQYLTTITFSDIVWSDYLGLFIAVGDGIYTSPDGETWTPRTEPTPALSYSSINRSGASF